MFLYVDDGKITVNFNISGKTLFGPCGLIHPHSNQGKTENNSIFSQYLE